MKNSFEAQNSKNSLEDAFGEEKVLQNFAIYETFCESLGLLSVKIGALGYNEDLVRALKVC